MGNVQFYDGKVLFVGGQVAMDPACCCGAPCECPGHPPLLNAYAVAWTGTFECEDCKNPFTAASPEIVEADGAGCAWSCPSCDSNYAVEMYLDTDACEWVVRFLCIQDVEGEEEMVIIGRATKATGQTPVGSYTPEAGWCFVPGSVTVS
jgi:hypothetical protein